jgi:hypothetical protein
MAKMTTNRVVLMAVAGALTLGLAANHSMAQIKKGKSRPLTTQQMMAGLVKPSFEAVNMGLQGTGPADDAAWKALATHAALLNESGHFLMDDGRCPDTAWSDATRILRESTEQLILKVEQKDAVGARETITFVAQSCRTCHTPHKK